ncbi:histidine kinase N-terminal domain-containing protein [Pseudokineococcus sp. 5B2Z-1]|uniref:sensor histidine kinase n=1 Tax=Pseudokineococcus sp. 5B2Z-1 TaxID=3132744 RepID=UPI003095DEF8
MSDLLRDATDLEPVDAEWLRLLVGDWQMVSDLAFADLVLWVPASGGEDWVAVAHCRPSTGPTAYYDDQVGRRVPRGRRPLVDEAWATRQVVSEGEPEHDEDSAVRTTTAPVQRAGRRVAVLSRHTTAVSLRMPSRLELTYMACADVLMGMVAEGRFPNQDTPSTHRRGSPRVGDGLVRVDADGVVLYASPNAQAVFHRLGLIGQLAGRLLPEVTSELIDTSGPVDESLPIVLLGKAPWRADVETRGAALSLRAVPLVEDGVRVGGLVLCRDVTELRGRELELISKDATIREIHHRVKNNLQTVAALLRLQSRRIESPDAKAALAEAMRRVSTIALVHDTLSQTHDASVDFDALVDTGLLLAAEVATPGARAKARRTGSFGLVDPNDATPLALVITELVTNAVEHGLADRDGTVEVRAERDGARLDLAVCDDGVGLPADFRVGARAPGGGGLGSRIVQTLVRGELRGDIRWENRDDGPGTAVRVRCRLGEVAVR